MELRALAERILLHPDLEVKLTCPDKVTDENPGKPVIHDLSPERNQVLQFKDHQGDTSFPALHTLEKDETRGRVLHFFANHELLATELMALVLLKFPEAPKAFRRGILKTLKDEQEHTRMYVRRLADMGMVFGQFPVNGYFWKMIAPMSTPMDYVSRLSLTFEQANLDFSAYFAQRFGLIGDRASQALMEKIYRDELTHVGYGLKWFRRWKDPKLTDWQAYEKQLEFPMSPQRAKAVPFNLKARQQVGLDADFIQRLYVYSKSKGRTPRIHVFNPYAEQFMMAGPGFTPNRQQKSIQEDLETLPLFLCRSDDVVLVRRPQRIAYLAKLKDCGFALPQTECVSEKGLEEASELRRRKVGALCPWAWSPCGYQVMKPLMAQLTQACPPVGEAWYESIRPLFAKDWAADQLRAFLRSRSDGQWLIAEDAIGQSCDSEAEVLNQIESLRQKGYPRVVVKSLYGSAGGNMLRCWESKISERQMGWIANALRREGALLVEPWLDRMMDFSVHWQVEPGAIRWIGWSHLKVDDRGHYRGSLWMPSFMRAMPKELAKFAHEGEPERLRRLFHDLKEFLFPHLKQAGYLGPVGVDAAIFRGGDGRPRLKPVIEINPRYTMGRLSIEVGRHHAPGSAGYLQILNQRDLERHGHDSFDAWSRSIEKALPVVTDERGRLVSGAVFLNDPTTASGCLALWQASRNIKAFWEVWHPLEATLA